MSFSAPTLRLTTSVGFVLLALLFAQPASATRIRRQATAGHHRSHHRSKRHSHKVEGQRAIDPARATEIQQVLVREHYLPDTAATGTWDASSQAAMQKFQADNGWQTKTTPDARALIKLGLGPKQDAGEYAFSSNPNPSLATPVAYHSTASSMSSAAPSRSQP